MAWPGLAWPGLADGPRATPHSEAHFNSRKRMLARAAPPYADLPTATASADLTARDRG